MKRLFLLAAAATFLFATGCVSAKTYRAVVDESAARQASMEKAATDIETAQARIDELGARVEALTEENAGLEGANEARAGEMAELRTRNDFLDREVERLKLKAGELSSEKEREVAGIRKTYEDLVREMKGEIEQGDVKITQAVDKLSVNFIDKILFDSGSAEIKDQGLDVLKRVGDIVKKVADRQIRVEGHTDDVPIGVKLREKFPTNWELSTARATTVVRYLQATVGIDPALLSAAGYSEHRPVADNATPEGKAQNRRIEIVLLPLDVDRVLEELKK